MAVQTHLTELGIESGIDDIQTIMDEQRVPNDTWYIEMAKLFQYGDTLFIDLDTFRPSYATVDEAARIIEAVTTRTIANSLYLKVKRVGGTLLSAPEKAGLESYLFAIKAAGTQILVQNYSPDELTLNMTILYEGSYDLTTIQTNVETAINTYLSELNFDSKFVTNELIDKLQEVDGVSDPRFDSGDAVDATGSFTTDFIHEYITLAGYAIINSSYPLSTTITYQNV